MPVMKSSVVFTRSPALSSLSRRCCAPSAAGILRAVANEANAGRLDERNQLIDFRLRLRIKSKRDRSSEQQGKNRSKDLAHEIDVSVLARCLEQPLDRQPAYHLDLDALPETGLGLGVVAHLLVTFASHPYEAVARRVPRDTRCGRDRARSFPADASPAPDNRRAHPSPCSVCSSADRDCRSR